MGNGADIRSAQDLFDAIKVAARALDVTGLNLWWRGQEEPWGLDPGVFRDKSPEWEHGALEEFRLSAPIRSPNVPGEQELAKWLFLAQHYGLRTRLLDWTQSPLFAAFFAVDNKEKHNVDGSLTVINPLLLNKHFGADALHYTPRDPDVADMITIAFNGNHSRMGELSSRVACVNPDIFDIRMLVQQTVFTIHGAKGLLPIDDTTAPFMKQFRIGAGVKLHLQQYLFRLGIQRSALFPDLENLSIDLNRRGYKSR